MSCDDCELGNILFWQIPELIRKCITPEKLLANLEYAYREIRYESIDELEKKQYEIMKSSLSHAIMCLSEGFDVEELEANRNHFDSLVRGQTRSMQEDRQNCALLSAAKREIDLIINDNVLFVLNLVLRNNSQKNGSKK